MQCSKVFPINQPNGKKINGTAFELSNWLIRIFLLLDLPILIEFVNWRIVLGSRRFLLKLSIQFIVFLLLLLLLFFNGWFKMVEILRCNNCMHSEYQIYGDYILKTKMGFKSKRILYDITVIFFSSNSFNCIGKLLNCDQFCCSSNHYCHIELAKIRKFNLFDKEAKKIVKNIPAVCPLGLFCWHLSPVWVNRSIIVHLFIFALFIYWKGVSRFMWFSIIQFLFLCFCTMNLCLCGSFIEVRRDRFNRFQMKMERKKVYITIISLVIKLIWIWDYSFVSFVSILIHVYLMNGYTYYTYRYN